MITLTPPAICALYAMRQSGPLKVEHSNSSNVVVRNLKGRCWVITEEGACHLITEGKKGS